jgi:hypothetical protein
VGLYRALLRAFPPVIRETDREEMAQTFGAQWRDAQERGRRTGVLARAFGRLPLVVGLEWRDELVARLGVAPAVRRRGGRMDAIRRLTRQATRSLRRSPAFTVSVVLLVALGVGSVSTIFAVVDHVLLRPLPYPSADRLFVMENGSHSGPAYAEFQSLRSVEAWAGVSSRQANLTGGSEPLRMIEASVTPGFFSLGSSRILVQG